MYFKSLYGMEYLVEVILYSSNVGVWEYMTADLLKLTLEDVLFKMSYSVDTLPTYPDYLKTKDDSHLNTFLVATSECVKIHQITHNKTLY